MLRCVAPNREGKTMIIRVAVLHLGLSLAVVAGAAEPPPVIPDSMKHVIVFKEEGRFGGWPANHGIWSWGNEILVGFEAGYLKPSERMHAIDYSRPAEHVLARSLDGGETWTVESPPGQTIVQGDSAATRL